MSEIKVDRNKEVILKTMLTHLTFLEDSTYIVYHNII
jgi:hypothetical protein